MAIGAVAGNEFMASELIQKVDEEGRDKAGAKMTGIDKQKLIELGFKLMLSVFAVLSPIKHLMVATGFLLVVDFITGIWASIKRGNEISSFKMRRTIVKALAYQSSIVVAFVIEKYMLEDAVPITKVVASIIALTEGKSFFENLNAITGINFWNAILNKVQGTPLETINKEMAPHEKEHKKTT